MDQSPCGCTWKRTKEYGDVIVVQCVKHARESRSPRAKRAYALADAAVKRLRKEGKLTPIKVGCPRCGNPEIPHGNCYPRK